MRRRILTALCLVATAVCAASVGAAEIIESVKVRGLVAHDEELILRAFGVAPGDTVETHDLRDAVRRVHGLSLFEDIQVFGARAGNRLDLELAVVEAPRLSAVHVKGTKHLSEPDVDDATRSVAGQILSRREIFDTVVALKDLYREKGFLNAEVEADYEPDAAGAVEVTIRARSGEKVRISDVYVSGNCFFDDEEILGELENKEARWFRGGEFKEIEIDADLDRIETMYRNAGFRDVDAYDYEISYKNGGADLVLEISLEEGSRYFVGDVSWEGNEVLTDGSLESLLRLRAGAAFNNAKFEETGLSIGSYYGDRGYIYSLVQPSESVTEDTVHVHYSIVEGDPAHVRRIEVAGNTKTKGHVIRRELHVFPGEIYSSNRLRLSQQRVFNLGYFENVEPRFDRANEEGDLDLTWWVEEKFTGQFNLAVGYSALDRVTGTIGIGHPNLFGNGWQGKFNWEFGSYTRQFLVSFTEPWLFDTPTSVGFDLFAVERSRIDYDEDRQGMSFRISRPVPGVLHTNVFTTWKVEDVDVDVDPSQSVLRQFDTDGPQRTISTNWSLVRNSRDNFQFPTSGSQSSISAEWAGGGLGGDVSYQKYTARSIWSMPTFWKFVLHVGTEGGYVDGFTSPDQVPIYERFEMGGTYVNPLRGYPDRSIGPRDDGVVIGGRVMLKTTIEYSFPVAENQVYALAFFDAGNAWDDLATTDPSDLKKGAGLGVRMVVPALGLIGFDFGYGFDREGGGQWEPHFQFGNQRGF